MIYTDPISNATIKSKRITPTHCAAEYVGAVEACTRRREGSVKAVGYVCAQWRPNGGVCCQVVCIAMNCARSLAC